MYRNVQKVVDFLSGEWMLTRWDKANGGTIILLRSFIIAITIFILTIALLNILDPHRSWAFDVNELKLQVANKLPWFGAIFAAVYLTLYSRFSSQWVYLSGLYNSIKQTEVSSHYYDANAMAEWKAGFIEDAECLHMVKKRSFAPIIKAWGSDELVEEKFIEQPQEKNHDL